MIIDLEAWGMALAGGVLIGCAATMLMIFNRRTAGISGILGGLVGFGPAADRGWRGAFIGGLVLGGALLGAFWPERFTSTPAANAPVALVIAGLLVGFGTRLGNGCTSGHGVCGLSRQSGRSLVATSTFIGVGIATVLCVRLAGGLV